MSIVCVFTAYVPAQFLKIRIARFWQVFVAIFAPFATIRVTAFLDLSARRAVAAAFAARVVDLAAVGHTVAAFARRVVATADAATVEDVGSGVGGASGPLSSDDGRDPRRDLQR